MIRSVFSQKLKITNLSACRLASTFKFIDIEDTGKNYSIVRLKKKPVNSLNTAMCKEIVGVFDELEKQKTCRGIVLTSSLPVFSAGLDILEMYQAKPEDLGTFWTSVQEMKLRVFSSPLVVIAAINGACPAGGCMLAFSSDYRIMADGKHTIGLNETKLGLSAPFWLIESMKLLIGHRKAEKMLALSVLQKPHDALATGLVDEVVDSDEVLTRSCEEMENWLKIADIGRVQTKRLLRRGYVREFNERREEDLNVFKGSILNDAVQKQLGMYMEALKKK